MHEVYSENRKEKYEEFNYTGHLGLSSCKITAREYKHISLLENSKWIKNLKGCVLNESKGRFLRINNWIASITWQHSKSANTHQ